MFFTIIMAMLFLWWIHALIFVKKPFLKSFRKTVLGMFVVYIGLGWWRVTIAMKDINYEHGCYVETKNSRGRVAYFETNGELKGYRIGLPQSISDYEPVVGRCYYVGHYEFVVTTYFYSLHEANPTTHQGKTIR